MDCHNTSKQLSYIKENLNLNFGQSENFILFSSVLFHLPSWIIVQSDGCFSIHRLEFLFNHRLSCHLELLSNQKAAFHLPSCIFDLSEMSSLPPHIPPLGIELSLLHYCNCHYSQLCVAGNIGKTLLYEGRLIMLLPDSHRTHLAI